MSDLLNLLLILAAIAVVLRVRSLLKPRACPSWLAPLLQSPWRSRDKIVERSDLRPGMRALEIGPAAGWITERALQKLGPGGLLVCLDIQPSMLRKVRARLGPGGPRLVCASGSELPFRSGSFDRLIVSAVLGEIPDKKGAMTEFFRVLRGEGVLAVTETLPDPHYVRTPVLRRLAAAAGFAAGERLSSVMMYTHRFTRPGR